MPGGVRRPADRAWTEAPEQCWARASSGLEEYLAEIGVDFPLDEQETEELNSVFDINEPYGALTLTTGDGIAWETAYTP